ncbi:hypothetical protein BKA81DRAFT_382431 [Phyllosticta paracitricarpa]
MTAGGTKFASAYFAEDSSRLGYIDRSSLCRLTSVRVSIFVPLPALALLRMGMSALPTSQTIGGADVQNKMDTYHLLGDEEDIRTTVMVRNIPNNWWCGRPKQDGHVLLVPFHAKAHNDDLLVDARTTVIVKNRNLLLAGLACVAACINIPVPMCDKLVLQSGMVRHAKQNGHLPLAIRPRNYRLPENVKTLSKISSYKAIEKPGW